jgi:chromosome segregation ATPase
LWSTWLDLSAEPTLVSGAQYYGTGMKVMAEISLEFIGTQLRRLQQEVEELRNSVERVRREGYTHYSVLAEHVDKILADFKTTLSARMDGFDQRFAYLDEQITRIDNRLDRVDSRLDRMDGRFDRVDSRLDRVDGQLAEIKALLLSARA